MNNSEKLDDLKKKMDADATLPLKKGATRLVFGVGNTDAKIVCLGEGPGYWEDQKGEPFVGNAGKLLDKLLPLAGLTREEVFITNVVHHRPPENRDPLPEEIKAYGVYLDEILKIINPDIIITLGRFSMAKFLPTARISDVHGKKYELSFNGKMIMVVPMYHPAASLRNGAILASEKIDFLNLKKILAEVKLKNNSSKNDKLESEQLTIV